MKSFLAALVILGSQFIRAEDSWRFITVADWHSAEKYTQSEKNPDWFDEAVNQDIANVKMLKVNYGGDFILLPGDSNGGHWDTKEFIRKNYPGSKPEEAILKAGHLCYSGMIDSFNKGGYSKLIMAVGDHEVGDNPWPAGSAVSRCQPQFRQAFAKEFNINTDGLFLYEKPIGKAASRPLGTPYENTSYAYRHKNTLLITVDSFHQESPEKVIGDQGTVTGTVAGKHLQWLDNILTEARKDESIKHIFVQSHLPVIYPVRKVNSSGMMMDNGMKNPFWKTLRKHNVDVYFAGEVHANTVTKDPESDLVQIVSRGNFLNNFLTVDISDTRIEVLCHNQLGSAPSDGNYEVSGRLVIDKTGGKTSFIDEGELAFLKPEERQYYFDFEHDLAYVEKPIMGIQFKKDEASCKIIRGISCDRLLVNHGEMGQHYNALYSGIELAEGINGKCGKFDDMSRMGIFGMGPLHSGHAVSYALWMKTTSTNNQVLINTGSIWKKNLDGFFNLNLNNGSPEVMISAKAVVEVQGVKLNDGNWHHIAVTMPEDNCKLSQVEIYVDGKPAQTLLNGGDKKLYFTQSVRMSIGGFGYSQKTYDKLPVKSFAGSMDDIIVWTRPISADEAARLAGRN